LNLLFDVGFNKEVGQDAALYWSKKDGDLAGLIDRVDGLKMRYWKSTDGRQSRGSGTHTAGSSLLTGMKRYFVGKRNKVTEVTGYSGEKVMAAQKRYDNLDGLRAFPV
jgi:hypothetical protein